MKIESIDTDCCNCHNDATKQFKFKKLTLELCNDCIKKLFWALSQDIYLVEDEE